MVAQQKNNSIGFTENKGQILDQNYRENNNVLFLYSGEGVKIQLRKNGYSYEIFSSQNSPLTKTKKFQNSTEDFQKASIVCNRIDIDFFAMSTACEVKAEDQINSFYNYSFNGKETFQIRSYKKITYKNVYPQTDIEFLLSENANQPLKYNIILRKGADINKVKLLCKGASSVTLQDNTINFHTTLGKISEQIPSSYYIDSPSENRTVEFNFDGNFISFASDYDQSKTLVIDPSSNIIWGTYFGDTSLDVATTVGNDATGNTYLAGYTMSSANIATSGAYQTTLAGIYDIFLAKFTPSGSLTWCTYFGGTGVEIAYAMYVEPNGSIYVAGDASSTVNIASTGAHQTIYGGGIDDALLIKFNSSGQPQWSTYYGGAQHDIAYAITVDNNGNPIIGGHTESANTGSCIATPSAYATSFAFGSDAFIAKFNSNGVRQWGTYYGDNDFEECWGINCDASGNIIATGFSGSISGLSTPPCHQSFGAGGQDAFISKFNPSGTSLIWGTYFGGTGDDQGSSVDIDAAGTIYIGGNTMSPAGIATPGAYQSSPGSVDDGFITAFSPSGVQLWGTYFGGGDTDYINDLELDSNNNLVFCGQTLSSNSISTTGAYQPLLHTVNSYDAFFGRISTTGILKLASYYGGDANDNAKNLSLDNSGALYLAGETTSTINISTPGSFKTSYGGVSDGFLAKFCLAPEPQLSPAGNPTICMNSGFTLTATSGYSLYSWNTGATSNPLVITNTFTPGNYYYNVIVTDSYGCNGQSDTTTLTVNNCVTGLSDFELESMISVYPVPAGDKLFVKVHDTQKQFTRIRIFSILGQEIYSGNLTEQPVNLNHVLPGVYILMIDGEKNSFVKKIVKQ